MRRPLIALTLLATLYAPAPARADHASGHLPPQGPAAVRFAPDFPALYDAEWGIRIGGFGGIARGAPAARRPVIFVHGNNTDHGDWYPVRDAFKAAGWTDQELWALSYNGLGSNYSHALLTPNLEALEERQRLAWDGASRITSNDVNVPDLYAFVQAVREYTGSRHFSIVAHSLGVTVARKMLKVHPELRIYLTAFVGIAGANHGTSFCPPGSEGHVTSCDEIAAGTAWLDELNGPGGIDETNGPARWLTIYDGTGAGDPGFAATYAQSPALRNAVNLQFPGRYHNDLRLNPDIVDTYRRFVEAAS